MSEYARVAVELARYINKVEPVIGNALTTHISRMRDAAESAQAAYDAGQADPVVKTSQDASWMTNSGYKHSAETFRESARRAEEVTERLMALLAKLSDAADGDDSEGL